eukprot:jgi/Bigna1/83435/fgenesh1_pg.108_\
MNHSAQILTVTLDLDLPPPITAHVPGQAYGPRPHAVGLAVMGYSYPGREMVLLHLLLLSVFRVSAQYPQYKVVVGGSHTCVMFNSTVVRCFGDNQYGQYGDGGTTLTNSAPGSFMNLDLTGGRTVKGFFGSSGYASFVVYTDNTVQCCGIGYLAILGYSSFRSTVTPHPTLLTSPSLNSIPGVVDDIKVGWFVACALTTAGTVHCWGCVKHGEWGNGTVPSQAQGTPSNVILPSQRYALSIGVGGMGSNTIDGFSIQTRGTACAVLDDHSLVCWGGNLYGQIGDGTQTHRPTPVAVSSLSNVSFVTGGGYHTCAIHSGGNLSCWGRNTWGQCGNGRMISAETTPQHVPLPAAATKVALARAVSCALLSTQRIMCWGENTYGVVGDGTYINRTSPRYVDVSSSERFSDISAGFHHICAVKADGCGIMCWGSNTFGQLGVGSNTAQNKPVGTLTAHCPSTVSPLTFSPTKLGPTPISAQFSDTYQSVRMSFHRSTNQPVELTLKATCDALLHPSSVALLGTNYGWCYWEGPTVFVVTLGDGFLLVPGNTLTLIQDTIQAENNALERNGDSAVVVSRASTNIDVSVVIVGETVFGTCGGVAELTANGEGSIAKPFTYTWYIVNNTGLDWEKSLNALAQQTTTSVLTLNGSMIPLGENVTVAVSVKNWLNDSATSQLGLLKVGDVVPSLTLPSSSNLTTRRSRITDINVQVRTPKCIPNLRVDAFWSQVAGPHAISMTDARSAYLRIPAFSLDVLATYQLRLVVKAVSRQTNATLGQQSVDFYLKVENEDLEATIAGGSSRTIPVSGNAYDINFDASASTDPAYPLAASGLSFNWSLFQVVSSSLTLVSLSSSSGATLSLSTAQLNADSEYLMRVSVSTNRSQSITAVASQTIITTSLPAPRVTLGVNLDKRVQDPHKKLVLNGRAVRDDSTSGNDDPSLALSWSSDATDFNISDRANLRSAIDARDLVIAPNVLIPGKTYKFTVQSTVFAGGAAAVGSASISVRVNSPPGSGSCVSSPDVGVAFETDFILSCEGFVDDAEDLPLRFKYQSVNGENAAAALASPATYTATQSSTYLDICRFRDLQSYKTKLAAPLGSSSPRLLVRAIVSDNLGSEGYYYFATNVTQPTTLNLTKSNRALTERLEEGDTQSFVAEVAALASFLSSDSGVAQTTDSSAADEREELLNKVASVSVTNPSSGESSASSLSPPVIASLAEFLTASFRPAEITTNVKSKTLDLLGTVTNSFDASSTAKATGDEGDTVASASGAISNLLTAASNNTGTTAATNMELANAERLERTLSDLSTILSVGLLPGEDQVVKGQQINTGRATVSISSRVMNPDRAFNTTLTSIDGATVSFELLNISSSGGATGVQLGFITVTGGRGGSLFPFTSNITSAYTSSLSIVEVKEKTLTGVRELAIANKSVAPFLIQVPTDGDGDSLPTNSDGIAAVRQCVFWSNVTGGWSTEGVEYKGPSADGNHKCESSHLSSFSTQPAFQVEVNTFSASDASNVNAYDPSKNPAMALALMLIGVLILLFPLTYYIDKSTAKSKELILKNERDFYRSLNHTRKMHYEDPRSLQNWKESIKLAVKRRHPWLSLCIRMSGDFIDSRKRLLILATLTFNGAAVCALLVGTEQKLGYIQGNIATAIVAMLIGYPIPYVITSIFARKTPPRFKVKFTPVGLVAAMPWLLWVGSILMGEFQVEDVAVEDEDDAGADDDPGPRALFVLFLRMLILNSSISYINLVGSYFAAALFASNTPHYLFIPNQRDRMDDKDDNDDDDDEDEKKNKKAAMAGACANLWLQSLLPRRQKSEVAFKSNLNLNTSVQSLNQIDLKNQSTVSNVGESQRMLLRTGTNLNKAVGRGDDGKEEEMVPITCCGIMIAKERGNINYSKWSFLDFVGAAICIAAVVGCAFIVVVLGYQSMEEDGTNWDIVTSALLTWPQDIGARFVTIAWLEAVLTAPLIFIFFPCCAVFGVCSSGTGRIYSKHTYTFDADEGVCKLDKNNFVTRLYPQAKEVGVKVGWRVIRLADASVSTKQETIDQLRRIHVIHRHFDITFDPSPKRTESKAAAKGAPSL